MIKIWTRGAAVLRNVPAQFTRSLQVSGTKTTFTSCLSSTHNTFILSNNNAGWKPNLNRLTWFVN